MEPLLLSAWALAIPAVFFVAALLVSESRPLGVAGGASGLAFLGSAALAVASLVAPAQALRFTVRLDAVTLTLLLLVTAIAVVIARYSRPYLAGEPGQARYERWLLVTLGSVALLVVTGDLLVLALAWTATSVALHQLLTFYPERRAALVAAHKKFILSRLADVFAWSAIALVAFTVGSTELDALARYLRDEPGWHGELHLAAVLFVVAVAMKSAQLPFHGWLTQVMEAPTPVSALLHAGVVNIGGLVLIRLAPLLAEVVEAQVLLVVIGLSSAVVASLVMTTRVSVKVALAWSTIAQLGFMLVQCGLGAWHLALLHLVAHSLYKAHAFLSAGSVVAQWRVRALGPGSTPRARDVVFGLAGALVVTGAVLAGFVLAGVVELHVETVALAVLLALGLATLQARRSARVLVTTAAAAVAYFAWHALAARLVGTTHAPVAWLWALVVAGFVGLFLLQAVVRVRPEGALARALHPWLFAGLWLDEGFTRLTFRVWPPRLGKARAAEGVQIVSSASA